MACFSGDGKPLKLGIAYLWQPGDKRVYAAGAQYLLGGPQRISTRTGLNEHKLCEVDARSGERRRIWDIRRR